MSESPKAKANQISQLLNLVLGVDRFPVDVSSVALEYSKAISPDSYITDVRGINIPGFEGCLRASKDGRKWLIAYNDSLGSPGRERFTLAHEFGHFMLHRNLQAEFNCTESDVYDLDTNEREIESEADTFASYLLMPLDDFRIQLSGSDFSLDFLEHCKTRYGVSRMAAALKWLEIAPKRALVVVARDGFLLWARTNAAAFKSGAFLRSKQQLVEVPSRSLLNEISLTGESGERKVDARIWFPKEPAGMAVKETAIYVDGPYPYVLGILELPDAEFVWRNNRND